MSEHLEIERKYLLKFLPMGRDKLLHYPTLRTVWHITQAYIESAGSQVRLRSIRAEDRETYILTAKDRGTLTRREQETEISQEAFELLLPLAGKRILSKIRYRIEENGYLWEIDEFENALSGIVFAEVEMDSEEEKPTLPQWIEAVLEREVTFEAGWSNSELTEK